MGEERKNARIKTLIDGVQLVVDGGRDKETRDEINGLYVADGEHDGKQVFRKQCHSATSTVPACIYFNAAWRSDDDQEMPAAWWFASDPGSEDVYVQNRSDCILPPRTGWGYDEEDMFELDSSLSIAYKSRDDIASPRTAAATALAER